MAGAATPPFQYLYRIGCTRRKEEYKMRNSNKSTQHAVAHRQETPHKELTSEYQRNPWNKNTPLLAEAEIHQELPTCPAAVGRAMSSNDHCNNTQHGA